MIDRAAERVSNVKEAVLDRWSKTKNKWSRFRRTRPTPTERYYAIILAGICGFIVGLAGTLSGVVFFAMSILSMQPVLIVGSALLLSASLILFLSLYVWAMM